MRNNKMNFLYLAALLFLFAGTTFATELDSLNRDPKYVETIKGRSQKIVDKLKLKKVDVALDVRNIIANKYFLLNDIYAKRDAEVKKVKDSGIAGSQKNEALSAIDHEKDAALYRSHFAFPADLSIYLDDKQVEAVKDGMTFGVVKVTYDATLDMIPSLKKDEKKQILVWLTEAREFAVDAENSNKKHEAFGKYKGRINNYLSKKGYDLVKERAGWAARLKAKGIKQ
ncbi:DUF3826 domain-containing protein [uncultured Bacteroides sp.]|uniref:DUF3826 domain-containing protein n=1 Tax=uncultured Bacteroides sp. TaxID=162156 RepID=UPI003749156B